MIQGHTLAENTTGSTVDYAVGSLGFPKFPLRESKIESDSCAQYLLTKQIAASSTIEWLTNDQEASAQYNPYVSGRVQTRISAWYEAYHHSQDCLFGLAELRVESKTTQPEAVSQTIMWPKLPKCYGKFQYTNVLVDENSTSLDYLSERCFETTRVFLQGLADSYVAGRIDIPEIARKLGDPWTENDVVILFERLGVHRSVASQVLTAKERESILADLARKRGTAYVEKLRNDRNSIRQEVIASQRIESVHVSPEDLAGE